MMPTEGAPSKPFDEQRALEELERLRDAIEASRRKRSETTDEFDAFVRSFRTPSAPDAPRTDLPPAQSSDVVARAPRQDPQLAVFPVEQPSPAEESVPPPVQASAPAPRAGALMPRVLAGAAILIVALVLLMRPWRSSSPVTSSSPSTGAATTASAPQATTPAPAATPAPAPAPAATRTHALEAELNVQRRVWVRATVDGQKIVERELLPGTRVPLQADRAIVIRVGDAGALRMTLNGVDRGPLGKDAEIVTRTFTASK